MAEVLLGEVMTGMLVSDRYSGYRYVNIEKRQLYWAHLYRDFVRISERTGKAGRLGQKLKRVTERLFGVWDDYRNGEIEASMWESVTTGIRMRIRGLLEQGAGYATRKDERSETTRTKNTCRELLEVEPAMWTFLTRPEIGSNGDESRKLRGHTVDHRKSSAPARKPAK